MAAIILLAGLLAWMLAWDPSPPRDHNQPASLSESKPVGGEFTLQSHKGPVKLSDFRSQVVLIYFGYTWCPDICPTNLGMISLALDALTEVERSQVQVLFISVDPERDGVERLREYGAYFHPKILGITGSPEVVAEVAGRYGASYRKADQSSTSEYVVDHTANSYLVNPQGELVEILPHATPAEAMVPLIRKYLR
jgi:protein SCO1/2